ncbi:VSP with INR [Giardia duodenalis]|uniref:VSP with INR n=2 Tax=Giardia intestinalis TaxID=5741 RepID=A0A644F944_GIAIC|nr:VSP with INR [Giardia intestinalis]XP_001708122.2 VSP with INR [Giardia intestinalis]KAE8305191.1 VSP with INR [Giardia intestinalis]KAE8305192.1 VSP with INR [Giardia intestinalis]
MLLVVFYLVLSALAAACKQAQNCVEDKCEMIGDTEICTQCTAGKVPIDGVCTAVGSAAGKCTKAEGQAVDDTDKTCGKCVDAYFMYKGGCYLAGAAGPGTGTKMCKQAAGGKCTQAADAKNYFIPPANTDDTHDSVVWCGDEIGVTLSSTQYKGVAKCLVCDAPGGAGAATCTTCEDGYFGATCEKCHESCRTCEAAEENKCKSCTDGYFLGATNGAAGKCLKCNSKTEEGWHGVDNCAKCTSSNTQNTPATCTECVANFYLKPAADATPSSCVTETGCGDGYFPTIVDEVKKCIACSAATNGGIDDCKKCSLKTTSAKAGVEIVCTECNTKWLSPLRDACLDSCPPGTHADSGNICPLCHSTCAECDGNAGANFCTVCYPGFVLKRGETGNMGMCVPECTGEYAENCEADQCTAVIGSSKYCSRCKVGFAPVDGVCVSTASRAVTGCTAGNDGTCTACTGTYFLQSGGCYQSTTYPGNTLCSIAASGKCTTCANGQTADSNLGSCPACPAGCSKCATSGSPKACSECFPGYYKSGDSCARCDTNNSQITGVANCVSCAPPSNGQGSVICYITRQETDDGTGDNTGGSTNKSGLSTGAIAGISVAVIVVVGGLVGFLCWWFICRGKA